MLTKRDFRPVTMGDREFFAHHYKKYPQVHSDNTFTNMVCWNHYAHYEYAYVRGNLVLSSTIEEKTTFRPPIGPRDPSVLADVIRLAIAEGDDIPLVLVDNPSKSWIKGIYPDLPLYPDRNYHEYLYRTKDLADLPGKKFLTIRHHLNKFQRNCMPEIEPITGKNLNEVRDFLIRWCEWKNCDSEPILAYEKDAVFFAVSHFIELGLMGLAIRVRGSIGAMALFEPLNETTALVHFEKGLPDCEGIYKSINQETARLLIDRFPYINRESDMGVSGLREAKMRYHPDHMIEVYYAKKEDLIDVVEKHQGDPR
jgi:uncharacterized protein